MPEFFLEADLLGIAWGGHQFIHALVAVPLLEWPKFAFDNQLNNNQQERNRKIHD
jgi:hypothetical protein